MFKSEYWYEIVKYTNSGVKIENIVKDKMSADSYASLLHNVHNNTEYPTITKKLIMCPMFNDYSILDVVGDCKTELLINIRENLPNHKKPIQQFFSLTRKERVYFKYALIDRSEVFDSSKIYMGDCLMLHPDYQVYQNMSEYNLMLYHIHKHEFENDVEYLAELLKEII